MGIKQDDIEGAQNAYGVWRVYMNTEEARINLFTQGLSFRDNTISVYENNPFQDRDNTGKKTVKVIVQNLPFNVKDKDIIEMFKHLGCNTDSEVKFGYEKDDHNQFTSIKNGSRYVFIEEEQLENNPLPRNTYCGNYRCRVWYYNQPKPEKKCFKCMQSGHLKFQCENEWVCRVCIKPGHRAGDRKCEHYLENNALVFQGKEDVLSNFYECHMTWKESLVNTSEKAYGYEEAKENHRTDLVNEILRASSGKDVKKATNKIHKNKEWEDQKRKKVMKDIIKAKAEQVQEVKQTLIDSGDRLIVEAVPGDVYWSCGLDKEAASKTDPKHFPGQNMLGKLYMEIRAEYRKRDENRAHAFQEVKSRNGSTSQAEKRKTPEDHSP